MPAAKMLADSTQSDAALERKKRRRDEKDHHRKNGGSKSRHSRSTHRNHHNSSNNNNSNSSSRRSAGSHSEKSSQKEEEEEVDSENSDMDLRKPLRPISSYVKNRSEMLDQMFSCIKGTTLKRTLPDDLQSMNYQELKQRCLAQLEVMSKKRILRILAGDDPENISSSGTEESADDMENTDKKITMNPHKSSQPCSTTESHPADSTSTSSASTKSSIKSNRNLSLVSPSSDCHLLSQPVPMPNFDNQSLDIKVAGYNLQTMGTGVSTIFPEGHAAGLHRSGQPPVISLQAEAGQLQSRPHISAHHLPPYQHTLAVDRSDGPISIAPPKTWKAKNMSILSSLQPHHHRHHLQKTQQWNATSSVRPFACSGSDYCICGHCSASTLLSQATATASSGVAATDRIGVSSASRTPGIPGSTPGGGITAKEPVIPARVLARTQMEILELEMRARSIKAMLQAASLYPPLQQQQQQPPPSL